MSTTRIIGDADDIGNVERFLNDKGSGRPHTLPAMAL